MAGLGYGWALASEPIKTALGQEVADQSIMDRVNSSCTLVFHSHMFCMWVQEFNQ
jgi:hypothetical protein